MFHRFSASSATSRQRSTDFQAVSDIAPVRPAFSGRTVDAPPTRCPSCSNPAVQ